MHKGRSLAVLPDCLKGRVVCGTVFGDIHLKRSPGIYRKSRVSYPGPGFLSSATWPSLPKKHCNGLINQMPSAHGAIFCRINIVCDNSRRGLIV